MKNIFSKNSFFENLYKIYKTHTNTHKHTQTNKKKMNIEEVSEIRLPLLKLRVLFEKYMDEHYDNWREPETFNNLYNNNYCDFYFFYDKQFFEENLNIVDMEKEHFQKLIYMCYGSFYITNPLTSFYTSYIEYTMYEKYLQLKKGDVLILEYNPILDTDDEKKDFLYIWDGEKFCNFLHNSISYSYSTSFKLPNNFMLSPDNNFTPTYWRNYIEDKQFYVCAKYLKQIFDTIGIYQSITIDGIITIKEDIGYFVHQDVDYTVIILYGNLYRDKKHFYKKDSIKKFLLDNISENFLPLMYGYFPNKYKRYRLFEDDIEQANNYFISHNIVHINIDAEEIKRNEKRESENPTINTLNMYSKGYPDMYMNTNFVLK